MNVTASSKTTRAANGNLLVDERRAQNGGLGMTARPMRLDAVLAVLDRPTVDHGAIDEALTILATNLRRQKRDGPRVLRILSRDGRSLVLSRDGTLVHEADPMGDAIAVIARAEDAGRIVVGEQHRDYAEGGAIAVAPGSVHDENGTVDADDGFRWLWSELAPALAAAIRAIPSPQPRPVLCDACRKEFYR